MTQGMIHLQRAMAAAGIAASLAGFGWVGVAIGHAEPGPDSHLSKDVYAWEVGDDDGNGVISEDESGWCPETMGNRVRGPEAAGVYFPGCDING